MGHGTLRVVFRHLFKVLRRLFVPERMQQSDTAFERLLHRGRARDGKMHCPQLFRCHFLVMMTSIGQRRRAQGQQNRDQPGKIFHGTPQKSEFSREQREGQRGKEFTKYDLQSTI